MSEDPVKMADDFAHAEANRDLDERERLIRKRTESVLALSQVDRSPLGQWPEDAAYLLDALDAARGKLEIEKSEVRDLSDILKRLFEMSRQFEDADGPTDSWYDLPTGVKQLWQERDAAREENGRLRKALREHHPITGCGCGAGDINASAALAREEGGE